MAESSYDCIVVGAGPGGYVAAIRAAQLGKKTAVIEQDKLGGRCLNYACIPAKAVLRSADLLSEIREAGEYGLTVAGVEVDYPAVQARRAKVVETLTSGVGGLFKKNGIDTLAGAASLAPAAGGDGGSSVNGGNGGGGRGGVKVRVGGDELDPEAPLHQVRADSFQDRGVVIDPSGRVRRLAVDAPTGHGGAHSPAFSC